MLDLAKFESGTFKFFYEFFDLNEIIGNAFEVIRHQADKKNISLKLNFKDERIKICDSIPSNIIYEEPLCNSSNLSNQYDHNNSFDTNQALLNSSSFSNIENNTSHASKK
jgi:signal transduction histidine kinase